MAPRKQGRSPCQKQTNDITEVMTGIRQQRQRVRSQPKHSLSNDIDYIQRDPDDKCPAEIRRYMRMSTVRVPGMGMSSLAVIVYRMVVRMTSTPFLISILHERGTVQLQNIGN